MIDTSNIFIAKLINKHKSRPNTDQNSCNNRLMDLYHYYIYISTIRIFECVTEVSKIHQSGVWGIS